VDQVRPYLARVIASLVAAGMTWALGHFHIVVSSHLNRAMTELIGAALLSYSITHTGVNAVINPTNAASVKVANETKEAGK
jgi:hypothetical protein